MARLIVNPDSPQAWVQELPDGECELGRSEQNHIILDHASVSSTHCRLIISDSQAFLKDLGSVGGTFINGELVEEARLKSGTVFRVGEVDVRFESDKSQSPTTLSGGEQSHFVAAGGSARQTHCRWHRNVPARHFCPRCNQGFCDLCIETRTVSSKARQICRQCGCACRPLKTPVLSTSNGRPPTFFKQLPTALIYPLRGNGLILILSGGVLFALLGLLPLIGLLTTGYIFNYAKSIVNSSAGGKSDPPDWPEFTNIWDDILVPYGQLIAITVVTFGPALLVDLFFPAENAAYTPLIVAAMIFGALLAPMGMLALAMFDSVAALNPIPLVRTILRIPGQYLIATIAFGLVVVTYLFLETLLGLILPFPLVVYVLAGFLNLYLLAVAMRILGLLYASHENRIGWFG